MAAQTYKRFLCECPKETSPLCIIPAFHYTLAFSLFVLLF